MTISDFYHAETCLIFGYFERETLHFAQHEQQFWQKRVVYYQVVVWFIKKIFCQFEKCSYFCNRFSEEKSAENDLLAQLV